MTQPSPHKWTIPQINHLQASWAKGISLDDYLSRTLPLQKRSLANAEETLSPLPQPKTKQKERS
jgi:hypothetical protein